MKRFCFALLASFLSFSPYTALAQETESGQPRLAVGSMITIPPEVDFDNSYNRADMSELLDALPPVDPALANDVRFNKEVWAKSIRFHRDVWCLQFGFKPMRIVYVDIPNKEGTFDKKAVWYLVYNVKNIGPADISVQKVAVEGEEQAGKGAMRNEYSLGNPGGSVGSQVETKISTPIAHDTKTEVCNCEFCQGSGKSVVQTRDTSLTLKNMEGSYIARSGKDEPIRFVPQFIFAVDRLVLGTVSENDSQTGKEKSTSEETSMIYVDQIIPIALPAIMKREGMKSLPETTVSITQKELESGEDVWGVAMWTDIDPRIHRFSVYVSGLSNIYRWREPIEGADRIKDRKTLKINWWRVGDRYSLNDKEIQYGFPGELDYEWVFR